MIRLFADDAKTFPGCASKQWRETLERYLNSLQEWANVWHLRYNTKKCKVKHLGKNPCHKYKMTWNDRVVTLISTECEKDLVVYFDTELNIHAHRIARTELNIHVNHVHRTASKPNGLLGLVKRSVDHIDMIMFKSLCVGLVMPHLEYANFVWTPFVKRDIRTIEKIQRRETRMIPELRT